MQPITRGTDFLSLAYKFLYPPRLLDNSLNLVLHGQIVHYLARFTIEIRRSANLRGVVERRSNHKNVALFTRATLRKVMKKFVCFQ